jgi:dipeptide/tripeptide permease
MSYTPNSFDSLNSNYILIVAPVISELYLKSIVTLLNPVSSYSNVTGD